ncbi:archease [Nanoarchaeota archaeon]
MEKYKFLDKITSDVMYEAYGPDLKSLFENAAEALFTIVCKIDQVEPKKEIKMEVEGDDVEDLMINWLQYLIASVDIEEMFFSKFKVVEIDEKHLVAYAYGEDVVPEKGETVVKAVTYHQYKFEKLPEGYKVRVSFDI